MIGYTTATAIFWLIVPLLILAWRSYRAWAKSPERYFDRLSRDARRRRR